MLLPIYNESPARKTANKSHCRGAQGAEDNRKMYDVFVPDCEVHSNLRGKKIAGGN